MSRFRYKAVSTTGDVVEGDLDALSRDAAVEQLRALGYLPIRAEEVATASVGQWLQRDLFVSRSVNSVDVAYVTHELATLLDSGIELERSLEILASLVEKPAVKNLLNRMLSDLRGGSSLSDAMAKHGSVFPAFYVSMIQAGETGGALPEVFARLADYLESLREMRERVRSALIYPILLMGMAAVSIIVLIAVVLPEFRPLFEDAGDKLPIVTRVVMDVSDVLTAYWWAMLGGLLILAVAVQRAIQLPGVREQWHAKVLRLPVVGGIVHHTEVARLSRTLGTLMSNGVPVVRALEIVERTAENLFLKRHLGAIGTAVKQGGTLSETLGASPVFPSRAEQLLRVGDESGRVEQMLTKIADIYDAEVARDIQRALALLTPALTIVAGTIIAGIISSMFVAILSVNEFAL